MPETETTMLPQGLDKTQKDLGLQGVLLMPCLRAGFVFLSFIFSLSVVNANGSPGKELTFTDNGGFIITAVDGGSATIHTGSITAPEGSSVKLLPGTHIKAGDELIISIVSREYHDGLAEQAAEEEQKQFIASIIEQRDVHVKPVEAFLLLRLPGASGRRPQVKQQLNLNAALPSRDQNSTSHGIVLSRLLTNQPDECFIPHTTFNNPYLPSRSWGNRGEMVAVMRA